MALTSFTDIANVKRSSGFTNNSNIVDSLVEPYVSAANSEVNQAIATRYKLPLSVNPLYAGSVAESALKNIATNLAAGFLMMQQYGDAGGEMSESAIINVRFARNQLKMINSGENILLGTGGEQLILRESSLMSPKGFPSSNTANPPKFTMDQKF
jgi:hypothetical protein